MSDTLKFLSWNVENFSNKEARVERVVNLIAGEDPDVFALFEVKGAAVFQAMNAALQNYHFSITESPGVPEILVGVRNSIPSFVTQKDELQSKVPSLRPGALATLTLNGTQVCFLFLHLKSFAAPRDWGLRDDMFSHVASLKRAIDKTMPDDLNSNFIAIGDINTMGMAPSYNDESDFDGAKEIQFVDARMTNWRTNLRRLTKTHDATWWNGSDDWDPSALDHAYVSSHLQFETFGPANSELDVRGWAELSTKSQQRAWIDSHSDHCALIGELKLASLNGTGD